MHGFTPISSLVGGALIGLAASALLVLSGKIAGISGIVGGSLAPANDDSRWRLTFVLGLLAGGLVLLLFSPSAFTAQAPRPLIAIAVAGLLVGFGTRLGSGCTSGHGVCGLSRFSKRALAATLTFMITGALTVFLVDHVLVGGAS